MRLANVKALLFALLFFGLVSAGWYWVQKRDQRQCAACRRPVPLHSRAVAEINNRLQIFCCPSCAFSEQVQGGAPVKIISLTDHFTGQPLDPFRAYLVRGSKHNPCANHPPRLASAEKHVLETHFDRCAPGVLAFADRQRAVAFAREQGGRVISFGEFFASLR
ncbi:MAG: nitrous oxide reductase accessory protein NosL [Bryobacteraceae bacterium]|nr:nitrous oxide reductase accessory protein NosL [Bryobacteraceae bacterium]MDW8376590.1 hypothetical protein [Bryobacterales bacterium]